MQIHYCDICGSRIAPSDLTEGRARMTADDRAFCPDCAASHPELFPKASPAGTRKRPSTGRMKAPHASEPDAPTATRGVAVFVISAALAAVVTTVIIVTYVGDEKPDAPVVAPVAPAPTVASVASGEPVEEAVARPARGAPLAPDASQPSEETPTPPPTDVPGLPPAPPPDDRPDPREAAADARLRDAEAYRRDNPDNDRGYAKLLAGIVGSYVGTAAATRAKAIHDPLAAAIAENERAATAIAPPVPVIENPEAAARWVRALSAFDRALLEERDVKAAAEVARRAQGEAALASYADHLRAMKDVTSAARDVARHQEERLAALKGTEIKLESSRGPLKGTLTDVKNGKVSVSMSLGPGATAVKTVGLTDIPEEQREKLAGPFDPKTDAQRIYLFYVRLARGGDVAGAEALLEKSAEYPLSPHCRSLAAAAKEKSANVVAEAAAPLAWDALRSRMRASGLKPAAMRSLLEELDAFEKEFGATAYVAKRRDELDVERTRLWRMLNPNMLANAGFEAGSFDGWRRSGGSREFLIHSNDAHTGEHALFVDMKPNYGSSVIQELDVEPNATYRMSCWVKPLNGPFDLARGGLFVLEGDLKHIHNPKDEPYVLKLVPVTQTGAWRKLEKTYAPKTTPVRFELYLRQISTAAGRYQLLIDDVEFAKVPE